MSRESAGVTSRTLTQHAQLLEVFQSGSKSPKEFKVGLELETLPVSAETGRALDFDGPQGIEAILRSVKDKLGWEGVYNEGRLIGLLRGRTAVTIEPGGQFELSLQPHVHIGAMALETEQFFNHLSEVAPRNTAFLTLGLQPYSRLGEIPWVPKSRYKIMRDLYQARGDRSLEMMGLTASIQLNLDFSDESDARKKVHVGAVMAPIAAAMTANACVEGGALNGYMTRRPLIWKETDTRRTGIPNFFLDGSFSFEAYADYAQDIPMYFIIRNSKYVDMTHTTFREFLKKGTDAFVAEEADWLAHLTTLFPDVRLKGHIEMRTADSVPLPLSFGMAALWTGLLYDSDALSEAHEYLSRYTPDDVRNSLISVAYSALGGRLGTDKILEVARRVAAIASMGLSRRDRHMGHSDSRFLDVILDMLDRGRSPAEAFRSEWNGTWRSLRKAFAISPAKTW